MSHSMTVLDRITIDPKVFGGKPCIRGMRFPVSKVLDLVASGMTTAAILRNYPYLEKVVGHPALGHLAGMDAQQGSQVLSQISVGETVGQKTEQHQGLQQGLHAQVSEGEGGPPRGESLG